MARPQKVGLDYFPLDVDMDSDDKVATVESLHGIEGFGVLVRLLMKIYKEGYYYGWEEQEQILFSKRVNVDINQVNEIINDCIKWGLFDKILYQKYQILTSKGIQSRYLEIIKRRNRIEIIKEYLLLSQDTLNNYENVVIVNINEVNANNNSDNEEVNVDINPQRKEKKTEKEIKYNGDFFETLWKAYPRKEGKGKVSNTQKKKLYNIGIDEMLRAIDRYKTSKEGVDKKFIMHGSTFFNSGYVDYLDANYNQDENQGDEVIEKDKELEYWEMDYEKL